MSRVMEVTSVPSPVSARSDGMALRERVVAFTARDGFACTLVNVRGSHDPVKGPVLLVHGAGVRANIFRPPGQRSIVDALVDDGYDVWLENWRGSIDLPPNPWTLDQAARYDHPAAVERVLRETGSARLKAIVHCQGSTSFFLSMMAGLLPSVTTVVSNAVSMHPVVPRLSALKLQAVRGFGLFSDYMNPQWGLRAPTWPAKMIDAVVRLTHHECDNIVCRHVSFTYGAGFPSLWRHENLTAETHAWISGEFAACSVAFFLQMRRSVKAGRIVPVEPGLPDNLFTGPPASSARIALMTGRENQCFLVDSQVRSFEYLERHRPGYHVLHVFPGYSHLDVFLGRTADVDVFPVILSELNRPT